LLEEEKDEEAGEEVVTMTDDIPFLDSYNKKKTNKTSLEDS
jgi:hypothetical protein